LTEADIDEPSAPPHQITALDVQMGRPISVLDRLLIMSSDDWEVFTLELVHYIKSRYNKVTKCGGGGDMGRDIIAYTDSGWHNYQCKHYANKLSVADAVLEIGKIAYYSYHGHYEVPEKYYFVSPQGSSTDLTKTLRSPEKLKQELIDRWEKSCATAITKKQTILLDKELLEHINSIDFSIFDDIPPLRLVELHSTTPFHIIRFGLYHKTRPATPKAPTDIELVEHEYTSALLEAFSQASNKEIIIDNLSNDTNFYSEFKSARNNFYSAEALKLFSRDWLPTGCFDELKEECHEAVMATVNQKYPDGYACYLKTCELSVVVDYSSHPLSSFIKIQDKKGLCHHLVNDKKISWVKK